MDIARIKSQTISSITWAALYYLCVGPLVKAFVIQNLWDWFVVGSFPVSSIAYWQVLGLMLLLAILRRPSENQRSQTEILARLEKRVKVDSDFDLKKEAEEALTSVRYTPLVEILLLLSALGLGWGIHTFLI